MSDTISVTKAAELFANNMANMIEGMAQMAEEAAPKWRDMPGDKALLALARSIRGMDRNAHVAPAAQQ